MKKVRLARQFRRHLTEPEQLLWQRLRRHSEGPGFRRQHPAGPYILDFYCAQVKLVIEVDGGHHHNDERAVRDEIREAWLKAQGLTIYRVPAVDVYRDADHVADGIRLLAEDLIRLRNAPPPRA